MSKGKKRCHFCGCDLNNQTRNSVMKQLESMFYIWVDACHACKAKKAKKP